MEGRSRRNFLCGAGLLVAGGMLPWWQGILRAEEATGRRAAAVRKVVVVIVGGVRRAETFSREGLENIPHLVTDLAPRGLFYEHVRNEGVTAHFNAISSILTGNWQRVDDWGKLAPTSPTVFEQYRKARRADRSDVWMVASNKALTSQIGASSDRGFGPGYGANVVFPKQLMLQAVADAMRKGHTGNLADRGKVEAELESALAGSNYEGLGWNVFDAAEQLDTRAQETVRGAIAEFVRGGGPTSGDELTFFMAREVMRKFAPRLMVVVLSDVEAAHFGSYAMHVAGIKTADRLVWQLWQEVESNAEYRGRTTFVVLPEFGRDPDGSSTNGFFNHRADEASTRDTWMVVLGAEKAEFVQRPVRHVDVCPTLAEVLGFRSVAAHGEMLRELRG